MKKAQKETAKEEIKSVWTTYVETVLMKPGSEGKSLFLRGNNRPSAEGARFCDPAKAADCCSGWFAPFSAAYAATTEEIEENCGLDCAMLIEFSMLSMRLIGYLCIPMSILSLMYIFAGGGAAREDILSWQGVGNVLYVQNILPGEEGKVAGVQWIYWVLGFVTNMVVFFVQRVVYSAQDAFLGRRKAWLKKMPEIQANTVLVRNIPLVEKEQDQAGTVSSSTGGAAANSNLVDTMTGAFVPGLRAQNDEEVENKFKAWFPEGIKSVFVVKKASAVTGAISAYCTAALPIQKPDEKVPADDTPEQKSKREEKYNTQLENQKEATDKAKTVIAGKMKTYKAQREAQKYHSTNAFVTFKSRAERESAVCQRMVDNADDYVMEVEPSPPPQDVLYRQLELESSFQQWYTLLGWGLIIGLFFMFMPIVLFIGKALSLPSIERIGFIKSILHGSAMEHTIGGILSSYGLTFMLGWLNFFLDIIIYRCFDNESITSQQLQLQRIYFVFLIIYVLLITCVGSDVEEALTVFIKSPLSIFTVLSNRMPLATHFYMFYVLSQPFTHGMNLCRYMQVFKYFFFYRSTGLSPDDPRYAVEPEDQGYYGVGARSARWELILIIGIVFGTICPLMNLCVLWNACVCRGVYGYLISCCETVKTNDSGGLHWNLQMRSLQWNLWWYIILMTGIIMHRAESSGPGILTGCSAVVWLVGFLQFDSLKVESLSLSELQSTDESKKVKPKPGLTDATNKELEYNQRVEDKDELFVQGLLDKPLDDKDGKAITDDITDKWMAEYNKNGITPLASCSIL